MLVFSAKVLLMPSGHSYFKDKRSQKVLPPEVRYAMVCEAAADNPHFTPSDFEIHREGNTYTYETLRGLFLGGGVIAVADQDLQILRSGFKILPCFIKAIGGFPMSL